MEPAGVALTGHVPPVHAGERPPCVVSVQSDVLLPEVPIEKPPCHRETLMATTEMPQEMAVTAEVPQEMLSAKLAAEALPAVPSVEPPAEAGKDPCGVELPPCPPKHRACPCEVPPAVVLVQEPAEQPSQMVPRGRCLIHNWQEERATNHLDLAPGQEQGSEGFVHRHGHHGLLAHQQFLSWPTYSTTTKDTYRLPHRVQLLGRGQREAVMESMLYQKYRKEMLEDTSPRKMPMESVSTTHQECPFTPQSPTQPHNYYMEQPLTFWLEQARRLPSVTSIRSGDSPFRRNAAFSTPITEYLGQPLPHAPLSSQLWPNK